MSASSRPHPLGALHVGDGAGPFLLFAVGVGQPDQALVADGFEVVRDVRRGRHALVEQVEIAVPVRVGLRQLALEFVGQGEVLMEARIVGGELAGRR